MKIKILKQKNKIILIDKTLSTHTRGIVGSMISTLGFDKKIIDIGKIFNSNKCINPLLNHIGYKSMANIIIPKNTNYIDSKESINNVRLLLSELLLASENFHGIICPYLLLSDIKNVESLNKLSEYCLSKKVTELPLKLLSDHLAVIKIRTQIEKITSSKYVDKIHSNKTLKTEVFLQDYLKNEEVFYFYSESSDNTDIVENLIFNSIKSIEKKNNKSPSEKWENLSNVLSNEIWLFNTSPTVHSDTFLKKC
jgi:hypothetical protein